MEGLFRTLALAGVFALNGMQTNASADLKVLHHGPSSTAVTITERVDGKTITAYEAELLYRMHLIVVRSDFRQFFHIHPKYDERGTFATTLPIDGRYTYYAYADTYPLGMTQQVFRFVIPGTGGPPLEPISTAPSAVDQPAGPYTIRLGTTSFKRDTLQTLSIDILRDGKSAPDLHPYLGAAGHVILINASTLAYEHVHPVMNGSDAVTVGFAGPHLMLRVPPLPAGSYKLWFQFRGGKKLYVGSYTIAVR